jgi:hypothetical protein
LAPINVAEAAIRISTSITPTYSLDLFAANLIFFSFDTNGNSEALARINFLNTGD